MPNATTIPDGLAWEVVIENKGGVDAINIKNNTGTLIRKIKIGIICRFTLQDNSVAAGVWFVHCFNELATATDADAVHVNVASEISGITEKTNPVSADLLLMEDSAATNAKKRLQVGNLFSRIKIIVKQIDEVLINNAVLQDDNDLKFAILLGEFWAFELDLVVSEISNNPNLKLRMGAINGLTGNIEYGWVKIGSNDSSHISDFTTDSGGINLSMSKDNIIISGSVQATASGTLVLQWSQNVSDADATIVHKCSKLIAHRSG